MTENLVAFGYIGLAVAGFIAGSAIPFSSEAAMSAALALGWNKWVCMTALLLGNWVGASTNYWIGRTCSITQIEKWLRIKREKIEKTRQFLVGKGIWLAPFSFFPFLGNALIICYGITRASFWKVGILMFLGRFVRYWVWMLVSEWAIEMWQRHA